MRAIWPWLLAAVLVAGAVSYEIYVHFVRRNPSHALTDLSVPVKGSLADHFIISRVLFTKNDLSRFAHVFPEVEHEAWWGCDLDSGFVPVSRITRITFQHNGKAILIPPSVFLFLMDAHTATAAHRRDTTILNIEGADAGESWEAILTFRDDNLIERQVCSGEFPDETRQITTFGHFSKGELDAQ